MRPELRKASGGRRRLKSGVGIQIGGYGRSIPILCRRIETGTVERERWRSGLIETRRGMGRCCLNREVGRRRVRDVVGPARLIMAEGVMAKAPSINKGSNLMRIEIYLCPHGE